LGVLAGCGGPRLETTYGRARGQSVNGTGALVALLRAEGHEVRVAPRLDEKVGAWADTLVRFAPYGGPPDHSASDWCVDWLGGRPGRRLVYVARDFDAEAEYWTEALARLPADASPATRSGIERQRSRADRWRDDLPPGPRTGPGAEPRKAKRHGQEFEVSLHPPLFELDPRDRPATSCVRLEGPWAEGI